MFDVEIPSVDAIALTGAALDDAEPVLRRLIVAALPGEAEVADAAAATLRDPALCGELQVLTGATELDVRLWLGEVLIGVIHRDAGNEAVAPRLVVGDPDALPRLVAALVDLGPRPRQSEPGFELPQALWPALAGGLPASERQDLLARVEGLGLVADLRAMLDDSARRWVLGLSPGSQVCAGHVVIDVIDAPARGLWLLRAVDGGPAAAIATDPSMIWAMLSGSVDAALLADAPDVAP